MNYFIKDHPNIVKIYEFGQDYKNFYIVTQFCSGGDLIAKISKAKYFSEMQAAQYMKQVLSAVCYCHARNIAHRLI